MVTPVKAILWLLILLSSISYADEFQANVDRTSLNEGDTFTLVLRHDPQVISGSPNINALNNDFRILNQQRSNQMRSINGKNESFTQWIYSISPLRTGTLTIPAIEFKNLKSQPISIEVKPLSDDIRAQTEQEFFFDVSINPKTEAYVQSQILYTEKLYFGAQHSEASLSELKIANARIQSLGDIKQYTTTINGKRFGVYERQFVIFPETSGELVIPAQRFNAQAMNPYDRWNRTKAIGITSAPINIKINAIPTNYPTNSAWLPARKLTIEEQFSTTPNQWKVGEAVTRTFTLTAEGIPGSQLPEIQLPIIDGLRYYPDQIRYSEVQNVNGVLGKAEQAVALVATKNGKLILPEIRIPWWNTATDRLEYAVLPAHTVHISGEAANNTVPAAPKSKPEKPSEITTTPAITTSVEQSTWSLLNILLGIALFISLLINFVLLKHKTPKSIQSSTEPGVHNSAKDAWIAFTNAVNTQDTAQIRIHLLAWVNTGAIPNVQLPITSINALAQQIHDDRLKKALFELDEHLFAQRINSTYNGAHLKQLLQKALGIPITDKTPSLYP